jgi:Ca2+/H+ antiporter
MGDHTPELAEGRTMPPLLSSMTLTGGRATVLQGAVHLVVFAVFLFLAMVP